MMEQNNIANIVDLCLRIDRSAYFIYKNLSEISEDAELQVYWNKLSIKQFGHIQLWTELSSYANEVCFHPFLTMEWK